MLQLLQTKVLVDKVKTIPEPNIAIEMNFAAHKFKFYLVLLRQKRDS